jgi:hypothetical protein
MSEPSSASGHVPTLQELRAARGARPPFHRRHRRCLIVGGVFVFLVLFGFIGLPPIVKAQAVKRLSALLGREVVIEKVRINPLVLSTTIEGFAIAEADAGAGEFTGWRRLYVNFDSWSLFARRIGFQEIALDGFRARVAKGADGELNFADIVARLTAPDPSAPPAEPKDPNTRPTPVSIGRLAVTDARVEFSDSSLERPFHTVAGPLSFSLEKFHTVGDPNSPYQFEAVTGAGERLAWRGTVSADPVKSAGELTLANIDLARLSPYYHRLIEGELRSAFLDVSGRYTFELSGAEPVLTLADGAVTLRDLRFGAPGADLDAFALKQLSVRGVSADSAALKADIARVAVEGVDIKVTRDAAGIDLLRLVAPKAAAGSATAGASTAAASATPAPTEPAALPAVTLGELSVTGVRVEAIDLTTPRRAEHRIEDLSLTLRDLDSTQLAKLVPLALEVKLPQDGRIALAGQVSALPTAADLEVTLERVPFANASPYVEPFLNIRLAGGAIRAQGRATLRDGAAAFAGDFGIAGFHTVDGKLAQDFAKWTDLSVRGIRAGTAPLAFHADEIRFVEPSAAIRVEADGSLSIAQAAAPAANPVASPAQSAQAPAALPLAVTVNTFAIERAAFRFEDRSIRPVARGGITDFGGTITGLSSEALGRADVNLSGRVDGAAPFSINGKLNPLGTPAFVDLKVDFRGIDLQPGAGPYVGKFAGRELARGNLNVAINAKLQDRRIDTANVVTLDQFHLGARTNSPDATSLPVGLALALLRDTQGRIVIDLPVKGSLDDPEFKIGRVVVRVLVNILTKAATSPFSLLGAAFGGGGDELGWQDFAAGSAALDEAGIKKLETVARALNGRPALSLDIVGAHDPAADLAALRRERLEQEVRALAWETRRQVDPNTPPPEQLEITPELRAGMLARLYAQAFPPAPDQPAPRIVAAAGEGTFTVPLVPQARGAASPFAAAEPRVEERPRRQVGRLPRFGSEVVVTGSSREPSAGEGEVTIARPAEDTSVGETGEPGEAPAVTLAEVISRLAERIDIPESELHALAESRARAVRVWLLETGKVSSERVFLAPVAASGARVNLNLK